MDCYWGACLPGNITFQDHASGLVQTGAQLNMVDDWRVFHSWDGGGRVWEGETEERGFGQREDRSHLSLKDLQDVG